MKLVTKKAKQEDLIELYEYYAETAEKVSDRRILLYRFNSVLLIAIATLLLTIEKQFFDHYRSDIMIGFLIAFVDLILTMGALAIAKGWREQIRSFRSLNEAKFKVIFELEEKIGIRVFKKEWEYLEHGANEEKYKQLSKIEEETPSAFMVFFMVLVGFKVIGTFFYFYFTK